MPPDDRLIGGAFHSFLGLDRTNMMQAAIARRVLNHQLHDFGLLTTEQKVEDEEDLMHAFRNSTYW